MKADFERFKTFSTKEERDAFKKEMQAKYNALPEAQKEAYKKASESGLKATVDACNDFIERTEEAILRVDSENCRKLFRLAISQRNISVSQEIDYIKELTAIS